MHLKMNGLTQKAQQFLQIASALMQTLRNNLMSMTVRAWESRSTSGRGQRRADILCTISLAVVDHSMVVTMPSTTCSFSTVTLENWENTPFSLSCTAIKDILRLQLKTFLARHIDYMAYIDYMHYMHFDYIDYMD